MLRSNRNTTGASGAERTAIAAACRGVGCIEASRQVEGSSSKAASTAPVHTPLGV